MNRTDRSADGQFLTTGEKAFVVMLAAGFFGYWPGFNLSAPGAAMNLPVAAAEASVPAARGPAREAPKLVDTHRGTAAATH